MAHAGPQLQTLRLHCLRGLPLRLPADHLFHSPRPPNFPAGSPRSLPFWRGVGAPQPAAAIFFAPNGAQANLFLRSDKKYLVDVYVAGGGPRVLSLNNLGFAGNTITNVYVVGSAAGGTLQVITHNFKL